MAAIARQLLFSVFQRRGQEGSEALPDDVLFESQKAQTNERTQKTSREKQQTHKTESKENKNPQGGKNNYKIIFFN